MLSSDTALPEAVLPNPEGAPPRLARGDVPAPGAAVVDAAAAAISHTACNG